MCNTHSPRSQVSGTGGTVSLTPPEVSLLTEATIRKLRAPVLETYARDRLHQSRNGTDQLAQDFQLAVQAAIAARSKGYMATINQHAVTLARRIERDFLHDANASAIDLIGTIQGALTRNTELPTDPVERARAYRGEGPNAVAWGPNDFPGRGGRRAGRGCGTAGISRALTSDLSLLRPERRVNQGGGNAQLLTRAQYVRALPEIERRLQWIPRDQRSRGPENEPANRNRAVRRQATARYFLIDFVADAFARLHEVAQNDYGVDILSYSAHRTAAAAARKAAETDVATAVAAFSPHMFGVAVDLALNWNGHPETSTRPFPGVVAMRSSPAHKFMFLFGNAFGWYPFQFEPWHWEYNPPGRVDAFPATIEPVGWDLPV